MAEPRLPLCVERVAVRMLLSELLCVALVEREAPVRTVELVLLRVAVVVFCLVSVRVVVPRLLFSLLSLLRVAELCLALLRELLLTVLMPLREDELPRELLL